MGATAVLELEPEAPIAPGTSSPLLVSFSLSSSNNFIFELEILLIMMGVS